MSAPERGGRAGGACPGQRPSAAPGVLPADAISVDSTSSRAGVGAVLLAVAAPTLGAAQQPPASSPRAATPGSADAPRAGLAAPSLHTRVPGDGAAAGGGGPPTLPTPLSGASFHGAGGASSSPGAGAPVTFDGAVARGGGVPGQGPAASPTPAGGASEPSDGPPVPVGDDGLPLSAAAAANPFSPPASARHVAFLKVVDHGIKAGLQHRDMRSADFSALAAEAGGPLFGCDSLIVASQLVMQAASLTNQAFMEPDPAEAEALERRAWAVLLAQALPVLQGRVDQATLLPGRLRKVEEAYDVYETQTIVRVNGKPVPGAAALLGHSRLMGYDAALRGAGTVLRLLHLHPWRSDERGRAQAFALAALRLIPKTAGLWDVVGVELQLVDFIERNMTTERYGADFCASVLAVWRSRAVADVLRARGSLQARFDPIHLFTFSLWLVPLSFCGGSLQGAVTVIAAQHAEYEARKQADLAKRGLWRCALPSCGKQEATVLQFRVCGHCQATRYCCPEHAKQHWKAHKREYEAEEEERRGEAGGGGAAA